MKQINCIRYFICLFQPAQAMFTTEWMESHQNKVAINGVEAEMIGLMVNYAYTSKVLITTANVQVMFDSS